MKKNKILYEDQNILAIDKPAGVLVDEILEAHPGFILAHRLDKETSGVLLLAKNEKAYEFLKKQFQSRTVKKVYNAVVSGFVKNDKGIINKPIGRSPSDFRRRLAGRGARGEMREAITEYKVLKRFTKNSQPFSLLEIRPKTGRTHQIRVHMKFANYPVVGDALYNPKEKSWTRMMLHAKSIEFFAIGGSASGGNNPKTIKVESNLPKEFTI